MNKEELIFVAADCPNGHRYAWKYTHGRLVELLDSGTLIFYCYQCDTHFPPIEEAILKLRKEVADVNARIKRQHLCRFCSQAK